MKQPIYLTLGLALFVLGVGIFINRDFAQKGSEEIKASIAETQKITQLNSDIMKDRPIVEIETTKGLITVELYADLSPKTVDYILGFAGKGIYDNTIFHRVIKDFMIQGGDPLTKDPSKSALFGTGDPGVKFDDEFNDEPLIRGSIAMANSGPNTNGSQFFIVTAEATPWLDGVHTNIGRVIGGMDIVDAISQVDTDPNDRPIEDVKVISVKVAKK